MSKPSPYPAAIAAPRNRIASIDALRGLVMLLMLVDHVREFFYLHAQVSDPMAVATTPPALFFTRLLAHLCAPVFIALAGLSACLYGQRAGPRETSLFLLKRGLFLVVLEWTLVNFAWTFSLAPQTVFLQVIWVIGLAMIALAALLHLPRPLLIAVGAALVLGHNLLDPIAFSPGEPGHALWAVLHDRGYVDLPWGGRARTSYPLLPWIGVIALGYAIGPWFAASTPVRARRRRLIGAGLAMLALFILLRTINIYGEPLPWQAGASPLRTAMGFVNLTKYPPSADFLLLTLGLGALLLAALERLPAPWSGRIALFGAAPLFFYLLHLYALHLLNIAAARLLAPGTADPFSLPGVASLWALAAALAVPLRFACRWFGAIKRRSGRAWLRYL